MRFFSRPGAQYTDRLPGMVEAFGKLPTQSAIADGELCLIDPRGAPHFYRLMRQIRTSHPDESQLMFLAFDLLHQDGVDLRGLPLSDRKRDLRRLCRKSRVPFVREVQTFPHGTLLFDQQQVWFRGCGFEALGVALLERLRSPPLSQGMARELKKQQAILEREIAVLEK